ncbi:MAG: malate/lactate/ureidoglycolate dehydrogenase [Magnetovibrio sp.]|nr:malate/lactate/ureidoglycolate dehydrogenase [Magnetovibrio sp.]
MQESEHLVAPAGMIAMVSRIFIAAGASKNEAHAIASNLVEANLSGHDSHGVVRVPRYLMWVQTGNLKFGRSITTVLNGNGFALLDGNKGFGQTIGRQAVDIGTETARKNGIALVALRRSGHLGRIGHWAEVACDAGLVSVHFVNAAQSLLVAPYGGAERRISTAPVCIGVLNPGGDNFILDFATSAVAEGKVMVALRGGKPVPFGALVDSNGQPSNDPKVLYGNLEDNVEPNPRLGPGALVAMGDHKGSGLALACELLAGALTGSGPVSPGTEMHNGMLSIYLKPEIIDDGHDFGAAVGNYIEYVRSARPVDPERPVLIPGDPERRTRATRKINGLPLPTKTWNKIINAGVALNLKRDELEEIAKMEEPRP